VIKSRRVGLTELVARIEATINAYEIFDKLERRDQVEYLGADGRIILKCFIGNRVEKCEMDSCGSEQRPVVGS
jgi:hypothetical protein